MPEDKGGEAREDHANFEDRMVEVLRKVKTLHLSGNRMVVLNNVQAPAKALSLSAEAMANGEERKDKELNRKLGPSHKTGHFSGGSTRI